MQVPTTVVFQGIKSWLTIFEKDRQREIISRSDQRKIKNFLYVPVVQIAPPPNHNCEKSLKRVTVETFL